MVKGISRQVILVKSPDPKLFEQAIFILKEEVMEEGVTEDQLMKEARAIIQAPGVGKRKLSHYGLFWAALGALTTGILWLVTAFL